MIWQRKEVYFNVYCNKCKYAEKSGHEDPCNDCLAVGAREGTHKPEKFEEKEDK